MAVVARDRCFWFMPKTASSFVEKIGQRHLGGQRVGGQHEPAVWMFAPDGECCGLWQVLHHYGTIRDPWSWYASIWRHATNNGHDVDNPWIAAWSDRRHDFRSFLAGATGNAPVDYNRLVEDRRQLLLTDVRPGAPPLSPATGLYSWAIGYMYQSWEQSPRTAGEKLPGEDLVGATVPTPRAWLVDALLDANRIYGALAGIGIGDVTPASHPLHGTAAYRERDTKTYGNVGEKLTNYVGWYDSEMLEWVSQADSRLYGWLGYCLDDGRAIAPAAVLHLTANRTTTG